MRNILRVSLIIHCRLLEHLYVSFGIEYELLHEFIILFVLVKKQYTRLCSILCKTSMTPVAMYRKAIMFKFKYWMRVFERSHYNTAA